ncbi:ionotropic receptor 25a-like [Trichogramma pretiosum]|uniref:ionotropic receptor 25a-like n=1 Tax=Trichogramma pretiosum TaxID=7493 RepID=UPI0006C9A68E|nr:ionotropic receptor 25a-like [Trichogramma pretiosum]
MATRTIPTYSVVTIPKAPFVMQSSVDGRFSGLLIDLLNELARRLRFRYKITVLGENEYGIMNDEGEWDGMIGMLKNGKADIGLAALSIMSERRRVVDFTEAIFPSVGISVLMRQPVVPTTLFRFLTILEVDVWLCIIGAYFLTSLLIWIFDAWSPYSYQNVVKNPKKAGVDEKDIDDECKRIFSLRESLWFCLTSLTPHGGGEAPRNLSGQLVAATWWLFGFIVVASYTANLAAFLTISKFEKVIESFDDLVEQYKFSYSVVENSTTYRYFLRMRDIEMRFYEIWKDTTLNDSLSHYERAQLAVWEYPLSDKFIRIFAALKQHGLLKSFDEAIERLEAPQSKFAFITEATDVKYRALTDCQYKEIGPEFAKKPYAIALQKNSNLTQAFNNAIYELFDNRWMQNVRTKWWEENPERKFCDTDELKGGITIKSIGGLFIFIFIGIGLSLVTLIFEYFYFTQFKRKFKNVLDFSTVAWERVKAMATKVWRKLIS